MFNQVYSCVFSEDNIAFGPSLHISRVSSFGGGVAGLPASPSWLVRRYCTPH